MSQTTKIAIVGIGAQLPSGTFSEANLDYHSFFQFLLRKGEAYEPIPKERFNIEHIRGNATGRVLADTGAFLKDIDKFDFLEFGITAKDARLMPLGCRKLIEVAFLAFLDSGIDYRGKNVGCYMSGVAHDFFAISGQDDTESKGSFASAPAVIANRVSYHLDLRGPSIPLDTACSSSLHTTHLAVQALRNGECDIAVAGGCQMNSRFTDWLVYTQGGILSPDGKCKPFDASANGFGRGEGAVAIVLKPLEAAIRDHDHIYGTILGTGVNSSGSIAPASAPVASAQRDAMQRAFNQTDRCPEEVDFLELHATGTATGDPTEANWVGQEFKRDDDLVIGSVKGNIGHLEITSFLASLCKVCGIFETGLVPPNVNFLKPNPFIHWAEYRFRVPVEPESLTHRSPGRPPLVAMTSSGIGGANGHCVIEGPPSSLPLPSPFWVEKVEVPALIVAGALSPRSVAAIGESLTNILESGNATALARTYGRRSRSMTWRSFAIANHGKISDFSEAAIVPKSRPPVVFVFSGQGTQYWQMGCDLFRTCTSFRESILEMDSVYATIVGSSLIHTTGLFIDSAENASDHLRDPWPIDVVLPGITMLQLALVDALAAAGVTPDIVIGHSAGETAVLAASGSASKAMALETAIARGRAMSLVEDARGTMAAVSCSPEEARRIIAEVHAELGDGVLEIGCYNTPSAVTLSGSEAYVELAVKKAGAAGVFARKLRTRVPVHSAMMELCRTTFQRLVEDVFDHHSICPPTVETYSTKTGQHFEGTFDAQYFWDSTIGPVRFTQAIETLTAKHKRATFVEIGPHPALSSYILAMSQKNTLVTCPLRRQRTPEPGADTAEFLTTLGKLVVAGCNTINFDSLYGLATKFSGTLPQYPFAPKTVPYRIPNAVIVRQLQHRNGPLNYPQLEINIHTHPELADHVIKGEPIMPAAGFIEMAFEFGAKELYDVEFHAMLPLSSDRPVPVEVKLEGTRWTVNSASSIDYAKTWPIQYNKRHASGYLSFQSTSESTVPRLDVESLRQHMTPVSMSGFYERMGSFAQFGPMYRRVRACHIARDSRGGVEVLTEVRAADSDLSNLSDYCMHPAILDASIHVMVHPLLTGNFDPELYHLPASASKARFLRTGPLPRTVYGYAKLINWTPKGITYDATIVDDCGEALLIIEGVQVALHGYRVRQVERRYEVVYRPLGLSLSPKQDKPFYRFTPPEASSNPVMLHKQNSFDSNLDFGSLYSPHSPAFSSSPETRTPSDSTVPSSHGEFPAFLILDYVRGEEMKIQAEIASHGLTEPLTLLFTTSDGVDGDAAAGFTRALRKEYRLWIIRLVIFDISWTAYQRSRAILELFSLDTKEEEMKVQADGSIIVPRVELGDPPSLSAPLDLERPWKLVEGDVIQTSLPICARDHVVAEVNAVASGTSGLWAFVGNYTTYPVVGISTKPISSHVHLHRGSIVETDATIFTRGDDSILLGPPLLAATIVALAVTVPAFSHPERLSGRRVLVSGWAGELGAQIYEVCSQLGMEVTLLATYDGGQLASSYLKKPDIVLSGTCDVREVIILRSLLAPGTGRMLLWNHPEQGVASIMATDPWAVGDALRAALSYHNRRCYTPIPYTSPCHLLPELKPAVSLSTNLFDSNKAYLLVGGIGSLGLFIALWMYENGAKHLVLTSRSGPVSLEKTGDWVAQRILCYLSGRTDLTVETPAIDATSKNDMGVLIHGISRPLAGCMFLAAVLNDRSFAAQTCETFEAPLPPKVDAFEAIEHAYDLDTLDFLVTFSSVSGTFGNAGQTNYATANTLAAGLTRKYKNAFSITCPAIIDSRVVSTTDAAYQSRLRHVIAYGMSARELCDHLGDGIHKLRDGRIWQYIPDFDWRLVRENMGSSSLYDHLEPRIADDAKDQGEDGMPSLVDIVCRTLDIKVEDVSLEVPLTTYGLDSLSAASLSFALRPLLSISQLQLLADLTIKDIQAKVDDVMDARSSFGRPSSEAVDKLAEDTGNAAQTRLMEVMLAQLSKGLLPWPTSTPARRSVPKGAIVVTGTTGSLGAHVLADLLASSSYNKVYALVRPSSDSAPAAERQRAAFTARGLDKSLLSSPRLAVITSILEKPFLGLSSKMYEEVRTSVSHILHLAWPTTLELPLSAFEGVLSGLCGLANLARDAREFGPVGLLFSSTFALFKNYEGPGLPKEELVASSVAAGTGYTESKWVAEQLLKVVAEKNIAHTVVVRIGQLAGGANGAWKVSEWLPSMISASTALRCLPQGQGVVSWIPAETSAKVILNISETDGPVSRFSIFHLRHPQPIPWQDIMGSFSQILRIPIVTYSDWLSELTRMLENPDPQTSAYIAPARRLLQMFQSASALNIVQEPNPVLESNGFMVLLDIEDSSRRCAPLRDSSLQRLSVHEVTKWVDYWRSIHALAPAP